MISFSLYFMAFSTRLCSTLLYSTLFYSPLYLSLFTTALIIILSSLYGSIIFHPFFCIYIILFFSRARTYNNLSDNIPPFDPGSLRSHTYTEAEIASSTSGELDVISGELERKWIGTVMIHLALKRVDGKWRRKVKMESEGGKSRWKVKAERVDGKWRWKK